MIISKAVHLFHLLFHQHCATLLFLNDELGISGEPRFLVLTVASLLTNLQLEAETVSRRVRSEFDVESSLSPLPESG